MADETVDKKANELLHAMELVREEILPETSMFVLLGTQLFEIVSDETEEKQEGTN